MDLDRVAGCDRLARRIKGETRVETQGELTRELLVDRFADYDRAGPVQAGRDDRASRDQEQLSTRQPEIVAHIAVEGIVDQIVSGQRVAVLRVVFAGASDDSAVEVECDEEVGSIRHLF